MDKKTIKELEAVLDKKFDQKLKPINQKLAGHDDQFKSISQKLDSLTLDMIDVQKKTDLIPDIHSLIKDTREKVEEQEQRIEALESAA